MYFPIESLAHDSGRTLVCAEKVRQFREKVFYRRTKAVLSNGYRWLFPEGKAARE
jgi:hypothetical protein